MRNRYYLKTNITSYFASIDHDVLLALVERKIKGRHLLDLPERIVQTGRSLGLSIGNYFSRFLANVYLNPLAHYVKDRLGYRTYRSKPEM